MYEPGRTGKQEHPYYPLHHSCHTPEHRTQTLTCHDLNPDTAYILHYIYSYLTQGQPEQGLIALSPQAKHFISKGIGVYATPILQPTTPVAHLARGLAIYAYLLMNPCRLPQPSPVDRLFFTDASGESALTPITGGATPQLTHTGGQYHMDHHTGHTTYGASSHGELGAMADAIAEIAAHLPAHLLHIVRVWFVVDATVDTHLLLRIARQPPHKATARSLGTQALMLWKALRSLLPYVQLHTVKQESHRHQYGNGKVDNQAVHQRTTHLPTLQIPDLGRNHTHLQHIPPLPEPHQTPDWVPGDAPYSSHERAYHYPNPIQHLARVPGDADTRTHIQELQDRLQIPLYHSALPPANVPTHLQKRRIQLLREQLPLLTRVARWLACKHIHVPEEHTRCPCDHTSPEDWEHFKKCPPHTGRDALVGWSPAETLRQHEGWPTHSHAHQATEHLFRDPLVKEATMRGAVTQALHRHLTEHTESPEAGPYGHSSRLSFDSFFCHIKQIKVRRVRRRQSATSRAAHYDSSAQFIKRLYFYEFWVAIFLIIKFSSFVYCFARRCYHVSSCGGPCKGRKIICGRQGLRRSRGLPGTWEHENQCLSCSVYRVRRRAGLR